MANDEHRMLFDFRGRRKRVIQVVYAALAVLMALSLLTVVGPVSIGDLTGGGSSGDASEVFDDEIERLERKLAKDPRNQALLVQLTRAQYNAANTQIERTPAGQIMSIPEEAIADFNQAGDTWRRYLKTDPAKPNAVAAQLAAQALLYAATTSTALEFGDNIEGAAEAQTIFAEAKPSVNSYLTLAQYRFYAGDLSGAEEAARRALQEAPQTQRKAVNQAIDLYRKQGQQVQKQVKAASQVQPGAGGKESLQNPLGGLAGGGTGSGAP